jgi:hypothetical protein
LFGLVVCLRATGDYYFFSLYQYIGVFCGFKGRLRA